MHPAQNKCGMQKWRTWLRLTGLAVVLITVYAVVVVPTVRGLSAPDQITLSPSEYANLADPQATTTGDGDNEPKYITIKLFNLIPLKRVLVNVLPFDEVILGGLPVGLCGDIAGVLVTADTGDRTLRAGDIITAVNGYPVSSLADLTAATTGQSTVNVSYRRGNQTRQATVTPSVDWALRDTTTGVGIVTMVNPADNTFTALGHPLTDTDTGTAVDLRGGKIYAVKTHGIVKTQGQQTGVIESSLAPNTPALGSITRGTAFGVTGCLTADSPLREQLNTTLPVATRYHVKPGAATLCTALDGVTVTEYSCEILKTRYQNQPQDKSMVIRVTDPRLLDATGGIVHGMSGSPIIQDGHLVGVLTHALTRDPAKGYALYIDFIATN